MFITFCITSRSYHCCAAGRLTLGDMLWLLTSAIGDMRTSFQLFSIGFFYFVFYNLYCMHVCTVLPAMANKLHHNCTAYCFSLTIITRTWYAQCRTFENNRSSASSTSSSAVVTDSHRPDRAARRRNVSKRRRSADVEKPTTLEQRR